MIRISEWLPDPAGNDNTGEWIEIENTGASPADLAGWALSVGEKTFALEGVLAPGELKVFWRSESGLALRNQNERIVLYDPTGVRADASEFAGVAPEGKSFARTGESFSFSAPTPGLANPAMEIAPEQVLPPVLRPGQASPIEIALSIILGGIAVATALFFLIIHTHDKGKFFFGRDEEDRGGPRDPHP